MRAPLILFALTWVGLWLTPDQHGDRLFSRGEYEDAAHAYQDPMRQGAAWYRAGEFEKAAQAFARRAGPKANFNAGNAWVMLGKYDQAIANYDLALQELPDWREAKENRALAMARAQLLNSKGGDMGDQRLGADEIVFDQNKPPGGQDTEVSGEQAVSSATVQALWLRNVQTRPADFLKAKFAYQRSLESAGDAP